MLRRREFGAAEPCLDRPDLDARPSHRRADGVPKVVEAEGGRESSRHERLAPMLHAPARAIGRPVDEAGEDGLDMNSAKSAHERLDRSRVDPGRGAEAVPLAPTGACGSRSPPDHGNRAALSGICSRRG
jgi:hypothetical protein